MPSSTPNKNSPNVARWLRIAGSVLCSTAKYCFAIWIFGLIWFAAPFPGAGNIILAICWMIVLFLVPFRIRCRRAKWLSVLGILLLPVLCYLFVRPSHKRDWVEPQAVTSSASVSGNLLEIQGFRTFDYVENGIAIGKWETRTYDLDRIEGMDFLMTNWTTDLAGHPIFSFDFGDQGHLAFTIEARMEKGENYSLLAGLYRRYELSYIPCEESDAVRVRTNFRENEKVYLYRTIATPEQARARLLEFIDTMNDIKFKPRFYNVVTSNCTTAVRSQMTGGFPFDWRIIANGYLDEMLYERGLLVSDGLDFKELKRRAFVNPKVREHPEKQGFSARIRAGITGF